MAKRETSKREEMVDVTAQVLEELNELRQEVRLAIEAAQMLPAGWWMLTSCARQCEYPDTHYGGTRNNLRFR